MGKYISGAVMSIMGMFAPVSSLILCAVVFIGVDFITGVLASRKRARKTGTHWAFESKKAWRTVTKLTFVMAGIMLSWLIDSIVLDFMKLNLANLFTGFVCGVEFWSYLENAAEISDHPLFVWLKKYVKGQMCNALNNGFDDEPRIEKP